MALFDINTTKEIDIPKTQNEMPQKHKTMELNLAVMSLIRQRMLQVWVHSYIYYKLGDSIILDCVWDKWARELAELIKKYPDEFHEIRHNELFADFDGSTGFIIASKATPNLIKKAKQLLAYHKTNHKGE